LNFRNYAPGIAVLLLGLFLRFWATKISLPFNGEAKNIFSRAVDTAFTKAPLFEVMFMASWLMGGLGVLMISIQYSKSSESPKLSAE
jgi:hypothetical protein